MLLKYSDSSSFHRLVGDHKFIRIRPGRPPFISSSSRISSCAGSMLSHLLTDSSRLTSPLRGAPTSTSPMSVAPNKHLPLGGRSEQLAMLGGKAWHIRGKISGHFTLLSFLGGHLHDRLPSIQTSKSPSPSNIKHDPWTSMDLLPTFPRAVFRPKLLQVVLPTLPR